LVHTLTARADGSQVTAATLRRNVTSWVYVPVGLLLMLLACFGVNSLIGLGSVSFPASVACMIVLFFALIACDSVIGDRRTRQIVNVIDIPVCSILPFQACTWRLSVNSVQAGFALRYINIFFTPSFVLLPLSPPISGIEVGKIIAVFSKYACYIFHIEIFKMSNANSRLK
jgi:hypothetical protein